MIFKIILYYLNNYCKKGRVKKVPKSKKKLRNFPQIYDIMFLNILQKGVIKLSTIEKILYQNKCTVNRKM